jgi:arginase
VKAALDVDILLVPYDSGVRGWRMGAGPEFLLQAGLVEHLRRLGHDVRTAELAVDDSTRRTELQTSFELLRLIAARVTASVAAGRFPLILAGNCLSACGILAGLGSEDRAVFWFDAHGDLNTPDTTPSGFVDGMALATALGWCWQNLTRTIPGFTPVTVERCCLIGARSLDPPERDVIRSRGLTHIAPDALPEGLQQFLGRTAVQQGAGYVHCDLDVLDSGVARVNQYAEPGGLQRDAYLAALDAIGKATAVKAAALTAYDPAADPAHAVPPLAFAIAAALVTAAAQRSSEPA